MTVRHANGFELSVYDVQALSKGVGAEAEPIDELVSRVRASEVGPGDFGAEQRDRVGAEYQRVVHELAGSLDELSATSERLADRLAETAERYRSTDDGNRRRLENGAVAA